MCKEKKDSLQYVATISYKTNSEVIRIEEQLEKFCLSSKIIQSGIGIEEVNIAINLAELAVLVVSAPMIMRYIDNKTIVVQVKGIIIKDPVNKIINMMRKNPEFVDDVKLAAKKHVLRIEGNSEAVNLFRNKIKEIYGIEVN